MMLIGRFKKVSNVEVKRVAEFIFSKTKRPKHSILRELREIYNVCLWCFDGYCFIQIISEDENVVVDVYNKLCELDKSGELYFEK